MTCWIKKIVALFIHLTNCQALKDAVDGLTSVQEWKREKNTASTNRVGGLSLMLCTNSTQKCWWKYLLFFNENKRLNNGWKTSCSNKSTFCSIPSALEPFSPLHLRAFVHCAGHSGLLNHNQDHLLSYRGWFKLSKIGTLINVLACFQCLWGSSK